MSTSALPTAWQAATRFCPHCSGSGCPVCKDSGDLLGAMLADAYQQGRDEVLFKLGQVRSIVATAIETTEDAPIDVGRLKRSMGLPA